MHGEVVHHQARSECSLYIDATSHDEVSQLDTVHATEQLARTSLVGDVASPNELLVRVVFKVSIGTNSTHREAKTHPHVLEFASTCFLGHLVDVSESSESQLLEVKSSLMRGELVNREEGPKACVHSFQVMDIRYPHFFRNVRIN